MGTITTVTYAHEAMAYRCGESHHRCRWSDAVVDWIRTLAESGWGRRRISAETGVPLSTVGEIMAYRRRACVPARREVVRG